MVEGRDSVVTVGTFDGVHRGHQAILRFLVSQAQERGGSPTLVTFDPHPREVVAGTPVPLLTTPVERGALAAEHGVKETVVLPFDGDMARVPAEQFVEDILLEQIGTSCVVIGYDHGFGAGRRGNRLLLEEMGGALGFDVEVVPAQLVAESVVSSSRIRRALLQRGDVRQASELLGRPYAWSGLVVPGDQRGRTIGYPTANLQPGDTRKVSPLPGVYAVTARTSDGKRHASMMNIGVRPTFDGQDLHHEVHILDFDGNLYGQRLTVEFRERLRDERKFDGIGALVEQLREDESRCRALLAGVA